MVCFPQFKDKPVCPVRPALSTVALPALAEYPVFKAPNPF